MIRTMLRKNRILILVFIVVVVLFLASMPVDLTIFSEVTK